MKAEVQIPSKINKCCDTDRDSRYALAGIQVTQAEPGRVYLAATNTRLMVVVNADGEVSEQCLIPHAMSPKTKKECEGYVRWQEPSGNIGSEDWTPGQWVRYDKNKRDVVRGGGEHMEGRVPNYGEVLPQCDERYLAVSVDPKYLLDCFQAMAGDNPESNGITMLLRIPESPDLMPSYAKVLNALKDLWVAHANPKHRLWGLCVTMTGDFTVDHYDDINHFDAETMRKFKYRMSGWPDGMVDTPEYMADFLFEKVMGEFRTTRLNVSDAIPLIHGDNFGVIMPLASNAPHSVVNAWNERTTRFRDCLRNSKPDVTDLAEETPEEDVETVYDEPGEAIEFDLANLL